MRFTYNACLEELQTVLEHIWSLYLATRMTFALTRSSEAVWRIVRNVPNVAVVAVWIILNLVTVGDIGIGFAKAHRKVGIERRAVRIGITAKEFLTVGAVAEHIVKVFAIDVLYQVARMDNEWMLGGLAVARVEFIAVLV